MTSTTIEVAQPPMLPDTGVHEREFDGRIHTSAGILMLIGAALLGLGTLSPWVSYVSKHGEALNRSAFQLGPKLSLTWFGPLLLSAAFLLAIFGVLAAVRPWRPNLLMPFLPTFIAGITLANSWPTQLGFVTGFTTTMGVGGTLCWAGVAFGGVATVLMLPAERSVRQRAR